MISPDLRKALGEEREDVNSLHGRDFYAGEDGERSARRISRRNDRVAVIERLMISDGEKVDFS